MQLTRFDRWLRETFIYETQVFTLRPPSKLPRGVKERKRYKAPRGSRYNHLYIPKTEQANRQLLALLNQQNQLFTTKIVERKTWYASILAPHGKSVTWRIVSAILIVITLTSAFIYGRGLWGNPEFRKNLQESLEILKK